MSNQTAAIHVSYYVYASAESAGAVDIAIDRVQFDDNLMERLSRRMHCHAGRHAHDQLRQD